MEELRYMYHLTGARCPSEGVAQTLKQFFFSCSELLALLQAQYCAATPSKIELSHHYTTNTCGYAPC